MGGGGRGAALFPHTGHQAESPLQLPARVPSLQTGAGRHCCQPQSLYFRPETWKKLASGKNNFCLIRIIKLGEEFLILFLIASTVSGGVNKRNYLHFCIFATTNYDKYFFKLPFLRVFFGKVSRVKPYCTNFFTPFCITSPDLRLRGNINRLLSISRYHPLPLLLRVPEGVSSPWK